MNPLAVIEKYYPKDSAAYTVLVRHSQHVQAKALAIAAHHPLLELDVQFIAEASMLHDIGIFMCDAPRIHCHGPHQYIEHGYLGADLLRKEGLPRHALVCERHTGVGLSQRLIEHAKLPLPVRDMLPVSMEEQLICYADKFFSKTQLDDEHSLDRIRVYLSRHNEADMEKFNNWVSFFEPQKMLDYLNL